MDTIEYESSKYYLISGTEVRSEIVSEQDTPDSRAFQIRSSCPSRRWGTRTVSHSLTLYKNASTDIKGTLERTRFQEAERIIKIESGELPEGGLSFLGIQIHGTNGKTITTIARPDLSLAPSLLDKKLIELLELNPLKKTSFQENAISFPLFSVMVSFGKVKVETMVAAADLGSPPCILGGDFFQKALKGKEQLIIELVLPDDRRALANAARCKKTHVLVLGKYGEQRPRLEKIKQALASLDFVGLILDEYPDIEEQSLPEKMVTYASICRFVVVDDFLPSGHIEELGICRERKFVTAILRRGGVASTAMQAEIADELQFIREFSYADADFEGAVLQAAKWANEIVDERSMRLNRKYSAWRGPDRIMRS